MPRNPESPERTGGSTIVELTVAVAIVGVAILVLLQQVTLSHRDDELAREKVFAYQKALGMLAELQVAVGRGEIGDVTELEARADLEPSPVLTTMRPGGEEVAPDHPMSGNRRRGDGWLWLRRVTVAPLLGAADLRRVEIEVLRCPDAGGRPRVVSAVAALVNAARAASPSVQQHDVYVLALAAVPSTALAPSGARAALEAAVASLEERSPGLRLRLHWITELGYGRDPLYVPYLNATTRAADAAPFAYWYPSRVDEVSPTLFAPELFGAILRTETGVHNGYDPAANPLPFTLADRFNHAMREPDARALFEARVAAGLADPGEPPLQLLLEDMHARPERFRNAILVNLHGDVLPFPPLRNESDAARDPAGHPGVRVVTHPARLRPERDPDGDGVHSDTEDLELRVYAYKTAPTVGPAVLDEPITVRILGVDLTANVDGADPGLPTTLEVRRLPGGVDVATGLGSGVAEYRRFDDPAGRAPTLDARGQPFEMAYECGFATTPVPHTWIRLHGTPLIAPPVGGRGLQPDARLYGMDYVPSPVAAGGGFPIDLASSGGGPKNTARWRIRVPAAVFVPGFPRGGLPDVDQRVTIETVLGEAPGAGTAWPVPIRPRAQSRTFAWWARSPESVPLTERHQVIGDPRLCPYADLARGGASFPHGYSWYFDDLQDATVDARADWSCFDPARLADGFAGVQADVPRVAQVWREALLGGAAVLLQHGGRLCGAVSFGGEVCRPAPPGELGPWPVAVAGAWYGAASTVAVDQLSGVDPGVAAAPGGGGAGAVRHGASVVREVGGTFWCKPWLGELAPDAAAADWDAYGNLPTAGGTARFAHVPLADVAWPDLPRGTAFEEPFGAVLDERGAASLLLCGVPGARFRQVVEAPGTTVVPDAGLRELHQAVGVGLPQQVAGRLTYGLTESLGAPLPQAGWPEHAPHYLQQLERFALGPAQRSAAGALRLTRHDGLRSTIVALDGSVPETSGAWMDAMRRGLVQVLRAFHVAGHPAFEADVEQLPRVLVRTPEHGSRFVDPASIELRWRTLFERFDAAPYTSVYPLGYEGAEEDLRYRVVHSADDGATWRDVRTGELVDLEAVPAPASLIDDSGPGDEALWIDTPKADFSDGSHLFRVLCSHAGRDPHRAWHEVRVEIRRTEPPAGGGK